MSLKASAAPDKFTGLDGPLRSWTSVGLMGGIFSLLVWLVTVSIPSTQQTFHELLREERQIYLDTLKEQRAREAVRDEDYRLLAKELGRNTEQTARVVGLIERLVSKIERERGEP